MVLNKDTKLHKILYVLVAIMFVKLMLKTLLADNLTYVNKFCNFIS